MTAERQCRDCQRAAIRGFTVCNDHLTRLLSAAFGAAVEKPRVVERLSDTDPMFQTPSSGQDAATPSRALLTAGRLRVPAAGAVPSRTRAT